MSLIHSEFMLKNKTAQRLYHEYVEGLPIIDYHCHISPELMAKDHRFKNATELFLGGNHYKWRLMRTNGMQCLCWTRISEASPVRHSSALVGTLSIGNCS